MDKRYCDWLCLVQTALLADHLPTEIVLRIMDEAQHVNPANLPLTGLAQEVRVFIDYCMKLSPNKPQCLASEG